MRKQRLVVAVVWSLLVGVVQADEELSTLLQQGLSELASQPVAGDNPRQQIPQAVAHFYADHQWQPVWNDERFGQLLEQIAHLSDDGLNPDDYDWMRLQSYRQVSDDVQKQSDRELLATKAYLRALLHLWQGKVDPHRVDEHWNFALRPLDPEQDLQRAWQAAIEGHLPEMFDQVRPRLSLYDLTRQALVRYRQMAELKEPPAIPTGTPLKPNTRDERVPLLRQRLLLLGALDPKTSAKDPLLYDANLVAAVQTLQRDSYLTDDGVLGPATIQWLNRPIAELINQLRANLERMRWFGQGISGDLILVDVAGYQINYMHDGKSIWHSRVQVGKEYRQTPIFQSTINRITLNPTWTVPPTILTEDVLPAVKRNPDYLKKRQLRVFDRQGVELDPHAVDWSQPNQVVLRQDAGADNSLGQIVVRFPNAYSVYLHDTPHKDLFSRQRRATSSGCIRVEKIRELAVLLLNDPVQWSASAVDQVLATNKTRDVTLTQKIPIWLAYWTIHVADGGYIAFKPDIYQQDQQVVALLDTGR